MHLRHANKGINKPICILNCILYQGYIYLERVYDFQNEVKLIYSR